MVSLYFLYYNFGRVHQKLRVTPAMEAGIADHVWSIEEIVALLRYSQHSFHKPRFSWSICFRMNARRRFLSSDGVDAGCQAFAEASARDAGIQNTRRAHTRNNPIVRAASRHRSRFARRSRDDRSRDNAALVPEPPGSASRSSIAAGVVHDGRGVPVRPHSRRRREQPAGRLPAEKSRAFYGRGVPLSSVEVSVRSNSHDKVVAPAPSLSAWFARAEERRIAGFAVY